MRDILDIGAAACGAARAAYPSTLSRDVTSARCERLRLARPAHRLPDWADLLAARTSTGSLRRIKQRLLVAQDAMLGHGVSRMALCRSAGDRRRRRRSKKQPPKEEKYHAAAG